MVLYGRSLFEGRDFTAVSSWQDSDVTIIMIVGSDQIGSCSVLSISETLLSSTDYYNGSLLSNCSISLAGLTMVACYLAELQLPTDESQRIRNKGRQVPLGSSGRWVLI